MPKREPSRVVTKGRIHRTVHRHDWKSLEEWVRTLQDLSELDDPEIEELVRMAANDAHPQREQD